MNFVKNDKKSMALLLAALLYFTPFLDTLTLPLAYAQQFDCKKNLTEAEQKFRQGKLDEAIQMITTCLKTGELTIEQNEWAYKLLGKAKHAKGLIDDAKQALRQLLGLVPDWRPNPEIDTPTFRKFAEDVIEEIGRKPVSIFPGQKEQPIKEKPSIESKKSSKKWLLIGGGAVVAGGILLLASSGGGGGGDPPPNPALPFPENPPDP